MAVNQFLESIERTSQLVMAEKNILPNLEATASDENSAFTPDSGWRDFDSLRKRTQNRHRRITKRRKRYGLRLGLKRDNRYNKNLPGEWDPKQSLRYPSRTFRKVFHVASMNAF